MKMHVIAPGGVRHRKRACTESRLWETNPLPHRGIEPASAACRSGALARELPPLPPTSLSVGGGLALGVNLRSCNGSGVCVKVPPSTFPPIRTYRSSGERGEPVSSYRQMIRSEGLLSSVSTTSISHLCLPCDCSLRYRTQDGATLPYQP